MAVTAITSASNQYIKLASSLQSKAGRKKSTYFLLEGEVLINEAIKNNIDIDYIFFLEGSEREHKSAELFSVDEKLMKKITSTESLVSQLALAKEFTKPKPEINDFILYCEEIQDPGNLGSIIRSGFAAGVSSIYLSPNCADLYNTKTMRSTKGAAFHGHISKDIKLSELSSEYTKIGSSLAANKSHYDLNLEDQKIILMVGNEAKGLSKEAQELCDITVKIPMANNIESLNVTAATSILLFECRRPK